MCDQLIELTSIDDPGGAIAAGHVPAEMNPPVARNLVQAGELRQRIGVIIDAQVAYLVNSYATRFTLGYRNSKAGEEKIQALFLGAQLQKF